MPTLFSIPSTTKPFPLRPLKGKTLPAPLCGAGNGPSDSSHRNMKWFRQRVEKKERQVRSALLTQKLHKGYSMAIAGITIQTTAEAYGTVRERLCASKDVADTQETGVPGMLAAVMETDAAYIEDALGALSGWDGVLNVGLVSISYEDELENKGYISCPEHKPRKCGPACFGETPNPLD